MKKLLCVLMLCASYAWAQETEVVVRPVLAPTTIASIVTTSGSAKVSSAAKALGNVVVGQYVYGPGIKMGVTVSALDNPALDSIITLSDTCISSATSSLEFGYFTSAAYSTGEWSSMPFQVYDWPSGGVTRLVSAIIVDAADVIGATDIVFFTNHSGSSGLYSAAAAIPVTDSSYILGLVSLTTVTDFGAIKTLSSTTDLSLALPKGKVWGRLLARSGATPAAATSFQVRLRFKE
jgi:hypothetical protein